MKVLNFKYFFTVLRLFPSCSKILFQSEAKWKAIDMKIIFYFHANKTCFHKNSFALSLVFRVICCCLHLPRSVIVLSGTPLTNNRKINKLKLPANFTLCEMTSRMSQNGNSRSLHSFDWRKSLWDQMSYEGSGNCQ